MKKTIKLAAVILTLAMLMTILGACSGTEEVAQPSAENAAQESEAVSKEAETETAEPAQSEEVEAPVEEVMGPDYYYLADEPTSISITYNVKFWFASMFPDGWGTSPYWDALEEKLNVEFEFNELMNTTFTEKVNLMIAGDETTDLINGLTAAYSSGYVGALDDEVIYDLAPYIQEYAPNYYAALSADENTLKAATNDDGSVGALLTLYNQTPDISDGLWIRSDWLQAVGKEVPTTPDELYDVLSAFKNEFGCNAGMFTMIGTNSVGIVTDGVWNAFGALGNYLDGDVVKYGLVQDHARDYLTFMRKLAQEGLFLTTDYTDGTTADLLAQNEIGIFNDNAGTVPNNLVLMDEGASVQAMAALGEPTEYGTIQSLASRTAGAISVFTSCDYPELICKLYNYLYTDEGSILTSYGIKGLSFNYVDGEPTLTDLVTNNPDGIPTEAALSYWTGADLMGGYLDPTRTYYNYADYQMEALEIFPTSYTGSSKTLPAVTLTTDENESISSLVSDMNTYINETVNQFVFGQREVTDENWQDFVDTMYGRCQLQTILDVYQAAYDRYMAK